MRIDLVSVFPEFFQVLQLSLLGKACQKGLLDLRCHDLRDWTTDKHRTVDDTPYGGGAGMVMKPDIWGKCLDDIWEFSPCSGASGENIGLPRKQVLAIPTPAGVPLTQAKCYELAKADHIVIACGRYEGIDSRVAQHYENTGVEVFEYSLGDYVINGGEVAAVALVESVGRLIPGMVGNPESLVEESHGQAGLLEYPIYTRPLTWQGLEVPPVVTSGDHGKLARWRRDRALEKTAWRRPDMLEKLPVDSLDKKDLQFLRELGWIVADGKIKRA